MSNASKIEWIQCGQAGPYQDSIYTGRVKAHSYEEAMEILAAGGSRTILDKQDRKNWHLPYFTKKPTAAPGDYYEFSYRMEYTR